MVLHVLGSQNTTDCAVRCRPRCKPIHLEMGMKILRGLEYGIFPSLLEMVERKKMEKKVPLAHHSSVSIGMVFIARVKAGSAWTVSIL
jgi:hypothetical protein